MREERHREERERDRVERERGERREREEREREEKEKRSERVERERKREGEREERERERKMSGSYRTNLAIALAQPPNPKPQTPTPAGEKPRCARPAGLTKTRGSGETWVLLLPPRGDAGSRENPRVWLVALLRSRFQNAFSKNAWFGLM